ncbi:DUF3253 domain-containing protein [Flaviflagellibacter deserti]|jgi:predicted nucleic acid-binding protein|uniref:DUF3253 domain-containing protein n=1 Tax=Flaviflagellibacter deserti TaxID=2267266 RepID=A0ABV9YZF6_9HYPH
MSVSEQVIEETILDMTRKHGTGKSVDPGEVAKALATKAGVDWHSLMQPVRKVAIRLARDGHIAILRKGKPVDPETFKGVYRLAAPD